MTSFFDQLTELPPDPIFGLSSQYKADPRSDKYTFVTGYFRDEDLKTPVLDSIAMAEMQIAEERQRKEYLPIGGDGEFVAELAKLIFGKLDERITGIQTVGATGALYLAGKLASNWTKEIAISNPTWANHWKIFPESGLSTRPYTYYENGAVSFEKILQDLSSLSKGAAFLVHTSSHNPTGLDLSEEHWKELIDLSQKKGLFPILDMAYQGFAKTPEEDAYPARLCLNEGLAFALTYTCAKNFSIYGERAGALFVVCESAKNAPIVRSHLLSHARASYSNPPMHAAALVKRVLSQDQLREKWLGELANMRKRMQSVRKAFADRMAFKKPNLNWEAIQKGNGLFFYSGLGKDAITELRKEKGYYLAIDGRINLTGLNEKNIESFTDALAKYL